MITVKNIRKTYQMGDFAVFALRGINLSIEAGEFVAIMGPSGSGKSTFMHIIGCLDRPTSGSYVLDGTEVAGMGKDELAYVRNQKIGFVFQGFNLIPRRPAFKQVMLPLMYNPHSAKNEDRAIAALERVGLGDRIHHKPNEMSGGQQQRVAIARALVNDPPIIMGDEPTGNLDTRSSEEIMSIFQDLHKEGKTVILVTHEEDIAHHAQRIIRFKDGHVVSDSMVENQVDAHEALKNIPLVDED